MSNLNSLYLIKPVVMQGKNPEQSHILCYCKKNPLYLQTKIKTTHKWGKRLIA